jgi:hypothetical protein
VLWRSEAFRQHAKDTWDKLGISDEIDQARLLAEELQGTVPEATAVRRDFRELRWALVGLGSIVLVFGIATIFAPQIAAGLAGTGFGALLFLIAGAQHAASKARSGMQLLRTLADDLRAASLKDAHVSEALTKLHRAESTKQVAEAQLESLLSQVGELERELAELAPGQRLYTFLADRAGGDSCRGNLGLISTIRKDFEQLVKLMAAWRDDGPDGTAPRPIDRVVLYIDDLDRCSPRQVVDVLQAVHLLLTLELFVVVVGVDPRWLVRALCHHYDEFLDSGQGAGQDGWQVTAEDYLEKILNIPLVLPGMPRGGLRQVIQGLIEDDDESLTTGPSRVGTPERQIEEPDGDDPEPRSDSVPVEEGSEVAAIQQGARGPALRPLTEPEIDLLAALERLVTTPREAKRLVNLYRMLRSTRDLSDASTFLGDPRTPGEYQAVVVLLGLLTAHARLLDAPRDLESGVRGGLLSRALTESWSAFLGDVAPRRSENGAG